MERERLQPAMIPPAQPGRPGGGGGGGGVGRWLPLDRMQIQWKVGRIPMQSSDQGDWVAPLAPLS
jgi:hypothetical protein